MKKVKVILQPLKEEVSIEVTLPCYRKQRYIDEYVMITSETAAIKVWSINNNYSLSYMEKNELKEMYGNMWLESNEEEFLAQYEKVKAGLEELLKSNLTAMKIA